MRVLVVIDESDHTKPRIFATIDAMLVDMHHHGVKLSDNDYDSLIKALAMGHSWADKTTYFGWHTVHESIQTDQPGRVL